ncbi:hypothetical protein [Neobacillus niacini]|uniref:hypothetical protein n=1 Tax=Neobacillus niacini TaxID=86668 RepID=UPI0005EF30E4|nr:hypothetical protein [Neobacillus niacini]
MNKISKFTLVLGYTGALTLSLGFININDLNKTVVIPSTEQLKVENGDQYRVLTREEQNAKENINNRDYLTAITAEEQNMIENSSDLSGYVHQKNGPGFFFEKVK